MCQDRIGGDVLNTTHEFLAFMLGVRRAGVTIALQNLEAQDLLATAVEKSPSVTGQLWRRRPAASTVCPNPSTKGCYLHSRA